MKFRLSHNSGTQKYTIEELRDNQWQKYIDPTYPPPGSTDYIKVVYDSNEKDLAQRDFYWLVQKQKNFLKDLKKETAAKITVVSEIDLDNQQSDVHTTHCCTRGCKYGDDNCPVANGKVLPEFPCWDCNCDAMNPSARQKAIEHNHSCSG
jgi:hypothetical protein